MATAVSVKNVSKSYGSLTVLHGIELAVSEGVFCSLLGPSGCGKTTLLNLVGGLDRPDHGEISIGGDVVYSKERGIDIGTDHRNIGYVFQSYALWPHMTVLDNVGYSLRIRRVPRAERDKQSREMLDRLELSSLADRYPYQLSGGQQQRVAIARSLVYHPRLLLLDEPLSNLDAQLRERARSWLRSVHDSFELTTILVTHDQSEALSLSDHIVLLNKGVIAQVGRPSDIYEKPRTAYAAEFVGGANVIPGQIVEGGGQADRVKLMTPAGIALTAVAGEITAVGVDACVAIRPQRIQFIMDSAPPALDGTELPFKPKTVLYQGSNFEVTGTTPLGEMRVLSEFAPTPAHSKILLRTQDCLCVGV